MTPNLLKEKIKSLLQGEISGIYPLHGGDLSQVFRVILDDGTSAVAKVGPEVKEEARMLRDMAATGARVPLVKGMSDSVLLLEDLKETAPTAAGWQSLGETLIHLHRPVRARYGRASDYAFGPEIIRNTPHSDWVEFWAGCRLLDVPDRLPADLRRRIERLVQRLPDLLPRQPAPALLHGDLWSGNVLFSGADAWLIDPACYIGHAEVDIAMLHLFGTPGAEFDAAYGDLEPGWQERRPIYQLWPALMHLRLFGNGYRGLVDSRLKALGF